MSEEVVVEVPKTKTEILSEMRELQQLYSKAAAVLKQMTYEEELKETIARQMDRLAAYKAKYNFYVQNDGTAKPIDWDEVEKLIKTSLDNPNLPTGYALGFDQTGMEGLGYDYGNGGTFSPMVEEENDVRKYLEREKLRQEFLAKAKKAK